MSGISAARHHADWLSLVEVSGPFVSMTVLLKVFPQGLEPRDPAQAKALRAAYEEWQENPAGPGRQQAWLFHVLTELLGHTADQIAEGQSLPAGLEANVPELGETLRPNFALVGPKGTDTSGQAQLLLTIYPAGQALDRPVIGKHWKANPATRMMELLHASGVVLGLVTNGEHWMLVYAPRGENTGYASWNSTIWLDEPITLRAFHSLLGVRRFFGVAADNTLLGLLKESAQDQQEVTDQLGYQVREAVEVLVQAFDVLDQDSNRTLLKGVSESTLYEAALTVMMRLVFLFSAEERGLLHLGKPVYDDNYAVSTLLEQLQEVADLHGPQVLERRVDAWARLLATFRAVHGGVHHQDLLMPAYGGSLFDPDRYPFLEGRSLGTDWATTRAEPLAINNRVALHLLTSLQKLRISVPGGSSEARRVSFRALGVEQIGHVYEGLLDHTAVCAREPVLGIKGTRDKETEIPLTTLESTLTQGRDKLIEFLKEESGRSVSALTRALNDESAFDEHRLLIACGHDAALFQRIRPFAGLIREDSFERAVIVLPGSIYVTAGTTRRSTGTHYTPPSLTEPIVQYTLEPLVYQGPAEGLPREQWVLNTPKEIVDLKVCDIAMGSGAFLVQACRYLAERLVETWENEENKHPGEVLVTPEGGFSKGEPNERLVPLDSAERLAIARRIVADRCLYGVDINPMAVEMAKLSVWLITLDAKRPFTFLDHAFKCGDSLLGLNSFKQLESFSLRSGGGKQMAFSTMNLWRHVEEAKQKREELGAMPSDTQEQIAAKVALYVEAEEAVNKLKAAADVLIAVELKGLYGKKYDDTREAVANEMIACWEQDAKGLRSYATDLLSDRRTLHWPLAYPEIMAGGGFDAFIGNPPYLGGQKITGTYGTAYRDYLVSAIANNQAGSANLCGYFLLRAHGLLKVAGYFGILSPDSIAQGITREVCLESLVMSGSIISRAVSSRAWPGAATVYYAIVWLRKGAWRGNYVLDDENTLGITSYLRAPAETVGSPKVLTSMRNRSFQGTIVLGKGFLVSPGQAKTSIEKNPSNREVLLPFLTGEDLNASATHNPTRWVINFFDWPLNRKAIGTWKGSGKADQKGWLISGSVPNDYPDPVAADYSECLAIVEEKVKPDRTRTKPTGEFVLRKPLPQKWWIYAEKRPALYAAIKSLKHVIVISRITNFVAFAMLPASFVFSDRLAVIAFQDFGHFAVLQSSFHYYWAWTYSVTNLAMLSYAPTACLETFPFPREISGLEEMGHVYSDYRSKVMLQNAFGLTGCYNSFHDSSAATFEIVELRRLHVELDKAVVGAYSWNDIALEHGFHETKQGLRYTISEAARLKVLDRLLALNHQRYAEEQGNAAIATARSMQTSKRGRKVNSDDTHLVPDLFN